MLVAAALGAAPASAEIGSRTGGVSYFGHVFPVAGPHGIRGVVGSYHAPRSGGRIHEGFDITAACGTPLVAVRSGRVLRRGFDPVLYGNYLLLHGEGERRSYYYRRWDRYS
jgi:murein DD-endopeptidase MepM/ murein hydrolase activator NlpD